MKKMLLAAMAASVMLASPAFAALAIGGKAPAFAAPAAEAGKEIKVDLAASLKKGPVVLYFYPAAFTRGCTIEAKEFALNIEKFKAQGASVIGVSGDTIDQLKKFSADPESCSNAFPVAAATAAQIAAFDTAMAPRPDVPALAGARAQRVTYVIAPDNTILLAHGGDPISHITESLAAVTKYRASHK